MHAAEREHQADQFLAFHAKRAGRDWESDFTAWSQSKDFELIDELAIKTLVHRQLLSKGDCAVIDLTEYFEHRRDAS